MTTALKVTADVGKLVRQIEGFAADQIPFAVAKALTLTAKDAQKGGKRRFGQAFNLKRKGLPNYAVRIKPAKKRDFPRARAEVGIRDDPTLEFLKFHEFGGFKRPKRGQRRITIPSKRAAKKRRTGKGGGYRKGFSPPELVKAGKARYAGGVLLGSLTKRGKEGALFFFARRARIRPRLGFRKRVRDTARTVYARRLAASLQDAHRTRRV